jgi:DNA-binding transcriptional LysR family regulator
MGLKGVTLRGLEVFEALAATGSVAEAAARTGLSAPAVSQQMRNLEAALGTALVDHARRPMQLTPAGRHFLTRARDVLAQLRLAQSEISMMDLSGLSTLALGLIDDFDNDLTPRLATILAESMTRCRLRLVTAPSHEITAALAERRLDLGIAASPGAPPDGLAEHPVVRDPFILVTPRGPSEGEAALEQLPFLRYDRAQLIGRTIEAHLRSEGVSFPERFEIGAHQALMVLVARGAGWAITTPLGYMRAARLHDRIAAHQLPFAPFARTISLFAGADWASPVPQDLARTVRELVQSQVVSPALAQLPWLEGQLRTLA